MPIRFFVKPNDKNLRNVKPVVNFEDPELQAAIDDVIDSLHNMQNTQGIGVGLAANQIGEPFTFYVVSITEARAKKEAEFDKCCQPVPTTVYVNPTLLISPDSTMTNYGEGCFSVPGIRSTSVPRASKIEVIAYDRYGNLMPPINAEGFLARVHQHENDHMKGEEYIKHANVDLQHLLAWLQYKASPSTLTPVEIPDNIVITDEKACDFTALSEFVAKIIESKDENNLRMRN